jgi:hypothetical protein
MAFVVHAFTILYQQHLRAFVPNLQILGYLVAQAAVRQQVKVVKINAFGHGAALKATLGHLAYTASSAVFKYHLRFAMAFGQQCRQLFGRLQWFPMHQIRFTVIYGYSLLGCRGTLRRGGYLRS